MKRLSFHYHLKITMDSPVCRHHFTLRCVPRSDTRQHILELQHFLSPGDWLSRGRDQWGNDLLYGCCGGQQSSFEANVCGLAESGLAAGTPAEHSGRERVFSFATPLTAADSALRDFSDSLSIRTGSFAEMETVMQKVHDALSYRPGTTTVQTTAAEAFSMGCGVCQDYAHVMLSLLRAQGIPSRYAAGMLLGEGMSHAWVEVLHEGLWTGYDPTNCLVVSDQHIKLSHGRDAQDCAINRGVFRGVAKQKTDISVIVTESEERRLC